MIGKKLIMSFIVLLIIASLTIIVIGSNLSKPHQSAIHAPKELLNYQNVTFASQSGSTLKGWFIKGKDSMGGILLMHSIGSNRLEMLKRALFLNRHGYSVLLFDFQGHGESSGKNITFGYLESLDASAAFDFLHKKLQNKSIGIIGVSLGGASAVMSDVLIKADALILESVYPTLREAIENRIAMRIGSWGKLLSPLLTFQLKPRLGFSHEQLKPIERIHQAKGAILIIAGAQDEHTTLAESQNLFEAANHPKSLWAIKGAAHINFYDYSPEQYQQNILLFFSQHLNPKDRKSIL
jgi:fermentation-respiration switch protein FrsA (DUF1100 family)